MVQEDQAIWVDLDQPQQLQATALEALANAIEPRDQPRASFLKPEWELSVCLQAGKHSAMQR